MTHVHAEAAKNTNNAAGQNNRGSNIMNTIFEKVNPINPDEEVIKKAAEIIKNGGLVAFPTETVYGLGADGLSAYAAKKIYEAKGRPSDNPLILHISSINQLMLLVSEIPEMSYTLMEKFWPGPLTMVFKKSPIIPECITGGLDTVAVRFPVNKVAQRLISEAGTPIAAPSANSSGKPSPTRASHVQFDLDGKIDMIIDGGACEFGLESTVVDVTGEIPVILRPGAVTEEMILNAVGKVEVDPAIQNKPDGDFKPKAPGMKYKHYSPKAKIVLVEGESQKVIEKINLLSQQMKSQGKKVGVMATEQTKDKYICENVFVAGDRENPYTIAANLFKLLRKFDYLGIDIVYSETFSDNDINAAIMNRLEKAAGYDIIQA